MTVETLRRERYCRRCGRRQWHKSDRLRPEAYGPWTDERGYALLHNLLIGWTCCACRRWSLWGRSR